MKTRFVFAMLAVALSLASPAPAASSRVAVTPKASTLGLGADLSFRVGSRVDLRVMGQQFLYQHRGTVDDVDYDVDLDLQSAGAVVDVRPFGGKFHVSAGLLANANQIDSAARLDPTTSYEIGDTSFTGAELGDLDASIDFASAAPYLGIGWGNPFAKSRRLGFVAGLGVIHQAIDDVTLESTNPLADPLLDQELEEEERRIEDDMEELEYFPVLSAGLSIRF